MSLEQIESSRQQGRPVNLFLLRYGSGPNSYYAYTDAEQEIVDGGITYRPVSVMRGKIAVSGTMDKATLEIRLSRNSQVGQLFLQYPPAEVVNVTIKQGHLSDPDAQFLVGWAGRVVSSKRNDTEVVLSCEPVSTSMKRVGLRRHYQYSCMHVLYGPQCRANKASATIEREILSLASTAVSLAPGWSVPHDLSDFIGGMLEWTNSAGDTEYRTILRISLGTNLTLSGPTRGLSVGMDVKVVKGCPRTMEGCMSHGNIHNFGGCPFIPKQNPVGSLNQFY